MKFIDRLRALLKPDPRIQVSKDEFDRAYLRFMQEVRNVEALIQHEPQKAKQHERR